MEVKPGLKWKIVLHRSPLSLRDGLLHSQPTFDGINSPVSLVHWVMLLSQGTYY